MFHVLRIYQTESDWCALVEMDERKLTLTYPTEPSEAQILEDAEIAFSAADTVTPSLDVTETTTVEDKRVLVREQLAALQALLSTSPELADEAQILADAAERLS